eukprot:6123682-Alexandrium_andersonii.AAC.1
MLLHSSSGPILRPIATAQTRNNAGLPPSSAAGPETPGIDALGCFAWDLYVARCHRSEHPAGCFD